MGYAACAAAECYHLVTRPLGRGTAFFFGRGGGAIRNITEGNIMMGGGEGGQWGKITNGREMEKEGSGTKG